MGTTVVIDGDVKLLEAFDGEMGVMTKVHEADYPFYAGPVEVTPSLEAQVLPSAETVVLRDIVVNPIPSNYGLITWNGAVLTVS